MTQGHTDWIALAAKWGGGWTLAFLLVYFLMSSVSSKQDLAIEKTDDAVQLLNTHVNDMKMEQQRTRYLLQAICFSVAQRDRDRAACAEAGR